MVPKKNAGSPTRTLRQLDDVCRLLTGKRLNQIVGRAIDLFGEDILKMGQPKQVEADPLAEQYRTLGVHPEAPEVVVKAAYRSLAREYHPDTGARPDPGLFQKATEAYNAIMEARKREKEAKG